MSALRTFILDLVINYLFSSATTTLEEHLNGTTVDSAVQARLDAALAAL